MYGQQRQLAAECEGGFPSRDLEQAWRDYRQGLLGFIRRRVGDGDLAEDLLQDVFTKAHSHLGSLADSERIQTWLYRIARNTIVDFYRTRKGAEALPDELAQLPDTGGGEWAELGRCVRPMIELLPEHYRAALVLFEIEGLPLKLVAQRLHLSLPGAKSRIQRGRDKLKKLFLDCCRFRFDGRGKPVDWSPRDGCSRLQC